ncbi:hypothetical protein ACFYOT_17760 [Saccharothrix saharensis]|uniref:hypothetical protein n=1 Tax=Saccharothrix saharensis TaxID=571190 RepID=UPI0036C0577D
MGGDDASRAILVGCARYAALPDLPAADRSVQALRSALIGPGSGWPTSRVAVVGDAVGAVKVARLVEGLLRDDADTLVFYYVGHARLSDDGDVRLAVADSDAADESTWLRARDVLGAVGAHDARTKLVVLDCCFAELPPDVSDVDDLADRVERATDGALVFCLASREGVYDDRAGGLTYLAHALVRSAPGRLDPAEAAREVTRLSPPAGRLRPRWAPADEPATPSHPEPEPQALPSLPVAPAPRVPPNPGSPLAPEALPEPGIPPDPEALPHREPPPHNEPLPHIELPLDPEPPPHRELPLDPEPPPHRELPLDPEPPPHPESPPDPGPEVLSREDDQPVTFRVSIPRSVRVVEVVGRAAVVGIGPWFGLALGGNGVATVMLTLVVWAVLGAEVHVAWWRRVEVGRTALVLRRGPDPAARLGFWAKPLPVDWVRAGFERVVVGRARGLTRVTLHVSPEAAGRVWNDVPFTGFGGYRHGVLSGRERGFAWPLGDVHASVDEVASAFRAAVPAGVAVDVVLTVEPRYHRPRRWALVTYLVVFGGLLAGLAFAG